jgi:hypothetical protein
MVTKRTDYTAEAVERAQAGEQGQWQARSLAETERPAVLGGL